MALMHYWRFSAFSELQCYRLGAFYDIIEGGRRSMVALSLLEILFRVDTPSDNLASYALVLTTSCSGYESTYLLPVVPGPAPPPSGLAVLVDLQLAIAQLLTALGGMQQAPTAILAPAPIPVPTPTPAPVLTPIAAPVSAPALAPD
ncbi:uncharacterized protein LOC125873747 [Solanum stenotomum]|uniref:uncharacterized protein LOC125873747 n=1 Tax=Solanum stenotomum TaxID=172797 RepID=UPI0020D0F25F|nr:uncharacterized protein LOC125873747 [Solanum stenotomum]